MRMPSLKAITNNALPIDSSLSAGIQYLLNLDLVYLLAKKLVSENPWRTSVLKTAGYLLNSLSLFNSLGGGERVNGLHFF